MTPQHFTPTLEYRTPGNGDAHIRVEGGRVMLLLDGAPLWHHVVQGLASMSAGAVLALVLLVRAVVLWNGSGSRASSLVSFAIGVAIAAFALRAVTSVWRVVRWGPAPLLCSLTSRQLSRVDPAPLGSDESNLIWLNDVVAAPGRLLYNGRRELLLRFILADGSIRQVNWYKSRAELERLVDELRRALRLDRGAASE